jgi:hypothetical protein
MMIRRPVDLGAITRDVRNRCARVLGNLELIAQSSDPIFPDPRQIMLEVVLANHEIESGHLHHASSLMAVGGAPKKRQWRWLRNCPNAIRFSP